MNKSILNAMKRLPCAEKENNKTVKCGKNANFPAYGLWPLESPLLLLLLLLPDPLAFSSSSWLGRLTFCFSQTLPLQGIREEYKD